MKRPAAGLLKQSLIALLLAWLIAGPAWGQQAMPYRQLPGWPQDRPAETAEALRQSCRAWAAMPPDRTLAGTTAADWLPACHALERVVATLPPPRTSSARSARRAEAARNRILRRFLEAAFQPRRAGNGLLTGYYEPELRGALARDGRFRVPLLALPPPPAAGARHPDRAAIEAGALDGAGLELAWVDDAADAFFLHIQGSGRVVLPDGAVLRLGYAGQNGHPYVPIGRALIASGAIARDAMSMQAIRAWLAAASAEDAAALLRLNPSYIFFRRIDDLRPDQGPPGAMGVPLTPGRSLAVDFAHIPMGAPVFLATRDPVDGSPIRRLVLAQDTGGAIRGPARGDLFWGWGADAALRAGRMREDATFFLLLPRAARLPGKPLRP